jgi:hypothetical protein
MSRQDGAVKRPLEDYLKGAELAFKDESIADLRQEVIRTERKPDGIWREAKRRIKVIRATADLSTEDEALTRSYWWLAKFKRDFPDEFYTKIQETEKRKMPEEKKQLDKMEFTLPNGVVLIAEEIVGVNNAKSCRIKFGERQNRQAWDLCKNILIGVSERLNEEISTNARVLSVLQDVRGDLATLVEEKFGLKVRTCGNCKYFKSYRDKASMGHMNNLHYCAKSTLGYPTVYGGDACIMIALNGVLNSWEPKEASK